MTISERIDYVAKSKGLSRRQLAIKAGIAPSTLQSAMQRGTNFSADMLNAVAEALEVPLAYLIGFSIISTESQKALGHKLESIGCRVEEEADPDRRTFCIYTQNSEHGWIPWVSGVSLSDLENINIAADAYMKLLLTNLHHEKVKSAFSKKEDD